MSDKIQRGRPIKGFQNKSFKVTIRLEPYEYDELVRISRLTGQKKADIIRTAMHLYYGEVKRQLGGKI